MLISCVVGYDVTLCHVTCLWLVAISSLATHFCFRVEGKTGQGRTKEDKR